jgi:hypothetical protein
MPYKYSPGKDGPPITTALLFFSGEFSVPRGHSDRA